MGDLSVRVSSLVAALASFFAAVAPASSGPRALKFQTPPFLQRCSRTVPLLLGATPLLLLGLAGCRPASEPAAVITQVVTRSVTDTPPVLPTSTLRPTGAPPSAPLQAGAAGSIDFLIPGDRLWTKAAEDGYTASGQEDTFAWSREAVKGDFEMSADVESDWANYGEAMVLVYGDGKGWTPGCLIFNVTGYWQGIRAHSIYDSDVEWVAENEQQLDFAQRSRYRMTVRVSGNEASLWVDDRLVAATPMHSWFNREGYIALVKYGGSAPITFTNVSLKTGHIGEVVAEVPSKTPLATAMLRNTSTPLPPPTSTLAPTLAPSPKPTLPPTATPPPSETPPPTATPPPPFRPPTGMLEDRAPGGQGELLIKNGTDADALVILAGLDDKAVKSAYIRNGESFNMTSIQDGTYRLYYSKGEAFNPETNRFTQNATYQRLDSTLQFTTSATQYTAWEVTLYGVVGGNVGSEPVDPSKFP
jgi:hypothetical protein